MPYDALKEATKGKVKTTGVSAFSELELSKVFPNAEQPRKSFDDIEELANSIEINGLVQPIAVVKRGKEYMIVSGERRYKACKYLGLKTIKCHILQANDKQVAEIALVENIQRDDLTDFEKAHFIQRLWVSGQYEKKQDLALAIGKSPAYISKAFKAVNICPEIVEKVKEFNDPIGLEVLQELSKVKNPFTQYELYARNATREEIRKVVSARTKTPRKKEELKLVWEITHTKPYGYTFPIEAIIQLSNYLGLGLPKEVQKKLDDPNHTAYKEAQYCVKVEEIVDSKDNKSPDQEISLAKENELLKQEIEELKDNPLYGVSLYMNKGMELSEKKLGASEAIELGEKYYETTTGFHFSGKTIIELANEAKEFSLAKENELLKQEIEELKTKQLYIISFTEKDGACGGGYRVRATHKDEAIELGEKYYGKEKGKIFFAETIDELNSWDKQSPFTYVATATKGNEVWSTIENTDAETNFRLTASSKILKANKKYKITIEEV